jgi:hypothetical protein
MHKIFSKLPFDMIREILLYDTHYVIRNKKLICINQIPETDYRFTLYTNVPRILKQHENNWSVIMGTNKRYVLVHRIKQNETWEYSYVVFSRDPHTNMMRTIPEYETIISI